MTEARAATPAKGTETILVVDDAEAFRRLIREQLEDAGYTVVDAEAPDVALRMLETAPRRIDLVLTDMVMPRMSGRAFVKRLADTQPHTRVVFMSGYSDNPMGGITTVDLGARFLQKPFSRDELVQTIREALDSDPAPRGGKD